MNNNYLYYAGAAIVGFLSIEFYMDSKTKEPEPEPEPIPQEEYTIPKNIEENLTEINQI